MTKLGDHVEILSGFAFKSSNFNDVGNGMPIVRIRDVGADRSKTFFEGEYPDEYVLDNGDFIVGMDGQFRLAEWQGGKALLNQRVCKITPKSNLLDERFLYHLLPQELKRIEDNTSFVTVKHLSVKKIKNIDFPLPPLPTQKKIAAILDAADAYRQKTKALIDKYDELAQSLFLDMFGDPVTNPKGWERMELENALEFMTSGSRGWAKYYSNSGDLFLRIQNVGYDELRMDDVAYVTAPDSAESKRTKVEPGDIILSITADLGRTAVIPLSFPKAHINQHLAILRLKDIWNPAFVSAYIASRGGQSLFLSLDKGGVKAGLNFKDVKSYQMFTPPKSLQDQFERQLQNIDKQKEIIKSEIEKTEVLFNSLLQRYFRGEYV